MCIFLFLFLPPSPSCVFFAQKLGDEAAWRLHKCDMCKSHLQMSLKLPFNIQISDIPCREAPLRRDPGEREARSASLRESLEARFTFPIFHRKKKKSTTKWKHHQLSAITMQIFFFFVRRFCRNPKSLRFYFSFLSLSPPTTPPILWLNTLSLLLWFLFYFFPEKSHAGLVDSLTVKGTFATRHGGHVSPKPASSSSNKPDCGWMLAPDGI